MSVEKKKRVVDDEESSHFLYLSLSLFFSRQQSLFSTFGKDQAENVNYYLIVIIR